jgi:Putative MetA-pathway of phenol degradation
VTTLHRLFRAILIALVLATAARGPAFAGVPYVTDDTETPVRGHWEINIAYVLQQSDPRVAQTPIFDFNYGFRDAIQLKYEMPILFVSPGGAPNETGIGDAKAGVKWRFLEETGRRPQLAIYPAVNIPLGNESRGLGSGSVSYFLPLIAQKSWGTWTAYANAGFIMQPATDNSDYGYYGATLTREIRTVKIGAEFYGNGTTTPGGVRSAGWNAGLEWSIVERFTLLASGGHSTAGDAGTTIYLGGQFRLGDRVSE